MGKEQEKHHHLFLQSENCPSVMDQAESADLLSLDNLQYKLSLSFSCIEELGAFELGDFKQLSRAGKEDSAPPVEVSIP